MIRKLKLTGRDPRISHIIRMNQTSQARQNNDVVICRSVMMGNGVQ